MALLRSAGLLRPFLAVARTGTLSAAARELSVSQPALTKSVQKLEEQVGTPLFERRARGMTLTPSGIAQRDFYTIHVRVVAGRHHPLHRRARVGVAELARYPWVFYQHDRDVMVRLSALFLRSRQKPPEIRVETTSLHAVMQLLRTGP